ncbi:hypothetical protein [Candidatus Nitrosocosmicus franklandus]|uniref:ACT domain-containing protein n=1 Tax=Candidatus Nitrosocosmicus franklandianus TaxID=1798806 RepID=A0A484I5I0_9ARCH|nr:hypothetical protein [Candidatus Nitrosocosmicus franklandus]VFJ12989.1 conserved protein of unknown function [Candidatus Nitrosocosmicus franklandus]
MYVRDVSVPQAVKEIILSNELYSKAIKSGIANYTAIANKIQPEVESSAGTKVNIGTIVVAIKRLADMMLANGFDNRENNLNDNDDDNDKKESLIRSPSLTPQEARMKLTGSIIDVDLANQESFTIVNDMLNKLAREDWFDFNLVRTAEKIRIVTEDMINSRKIIASLTEDCQGKVTEGLSKITITLFYENMEGIRRLLFGIFDILGNHKIAIHNVFFTSNEIILILERNHAVRAYDLLQNMIFKK